MTSGTAPRQPKRLGADDYERLLALWETTDLPIRPKGRDSREAFAAQMAGGTQTVLGIEADGELAGAVVVTHDGRKGWINRLAVHPDHRRQGIARELLAASEETLKAEGIHVIAALIEGENPASYALFDAAGYVVHHDIAYLTKRDSAEA